MSNKPHPEWQYKPFRLSSEEIKNPQEVISRFLEAYDLPDCRGLLWEIQATAFNGNAAEGLDGTQVGEMIFFCRQLEEVIEAVYVLNNK